MYQQEKSSSTVKLPNIENKSAREGGDNERERFQAKNWKVLSKKEIQKLPPQQKSKYLAVRKKYHEGYAIVYRRWWVLENFA